MTSIDEGTRLDYTAQASVAGKLGQIGGRLMDASARQLADRFFVAFKTQVSDAGSNERPLAIAAVSGPGGTESPASAPASFPIVPCVSTASSRVQIEHWFAKEKPRLLWFSAGVVATSIGVWMGAHWLR